NVTLSYTELDDTVARFAGWLRTRGVLPGDRVGLMVVNSLEFAITYYGVLRAGAVVVPMNVLCKRREVAYHLSDAGARLLIASRVCAEAAESGAVQAGAEYLLIDAGELDRVTRDVAPWPLGERDGDDTAVILYTWGTTGRSKGAELTHANLGRNAEMAQRIIGLDTSSVVLGALPLFHAFGQTCTLNASLVA